MAEYIERQAAMIVPVLPKEYRQYQTENLDDAYEQGWLDATGNLKNVPAADVALVKHGKWERIGIVGKNLPLYPVCSACGIVSAAYRSQWEGLQGAWKFCPYCGARMDGEE